MMMGKPEWGQCHLQWEESFQFIELLTKCVSSELGSNCPYSLMLEGIIAPLDLMNLFSLPYLHYPIRAMITNIEKGKNRVGPHLDIIP